ncbi:tRNA pseudouridine(55) synthase TruB [Herbiconiux moechotypicola]|uniref:tRNA pseudouridine synthase B n=1 Tax=Herbiconiux moechotypicola TaxID=637393 RepID=A0ABN3D7D1_9MICO|nr:tRNA pseudouridine(55) synthase TruB [Herbiconiux moechotypicola]MCS5728449.1 tRNA pseudouridine(55) synthase TruB [Herbiconiux moechotypicola]
MTSPSGASGILLVDKPQGLTSHDVVARTRRLAGTRKVGHAGTLDPMATGLLVLGLNSSTRLLTYVVGLDKEYLATVRLGTATTTDDAEGELLEPVPGALDPTDLAVADVEAAFAAQTGRIEQVPSSVSAIKVDGKRAYARVREGEEVALAARVVTIAEIELLGPPRPVSNPGGPDAPQHFLDVDVRVVCSSGTYIRAIARDVGRALGVGGHLTALRRTRIGPFGVGDAHELDALGRFAEAGDPLPLRPAAETAARLFPVWNLDPASATALGHGQRVDVPNPVPWSPQTDGPIAAITPGGRLLGLVESRDGRAKSIVNFPPDETGAAS